MKVYIVDDIDSGSIVGVYSTPEKAEKVKQSYIEENGQLTVVFITEFELDKE